MTARPLRYLVVPGWTSSGPDHWQSRWERAHPDWERIEMGDWERPDPADWVARIEAAVAAPGPPAVLVAHSLGSLAIARWAAAPASSTDRVAAAFLVAPPDVERDGTPEELWKFAPIPRVPLPFRALVVASRDDPWIGPDRVRALAAAWRASFVDVGMAGHLNTDAGYGPWPLGEWLLADFVGGV